MHTSSSQTSSRASSRVVTFPRIIMLLAPVAMTAAAMAQPVASEQVEAAKQIFEGKILGNQVTVRSGPSENYYPVARLDAGTLVVVNGIKFDWLRISPPEGTFSLIAKQYVDVTGGTGRVNAASVNVRAGSQLSSQFATVQTKLSRGDTVVVLGEMTTTDGVFLKIKPPPGAYLFVKKDFVAPVRVIGAAPVEPVSGGRPAPTNDFGSPTTRAVPTGSGTTGGSSTGGTAGGGGGGAFGGGVAGDATGLPPDATTRPSTIPPAELTRRDQAELAYSQADQALSELTGKALEDQPLPELLARFEALAVNEDLPISLRKQAASTAEFLKARNVTREELLAVKRQQLEMQAKLQPLREENRQLVDKYRQLEMTVFTAAGALQNSTLQQAGHSLLRLVDPATGHTLVYIKTTDGGLVGQFVGVKGTVTRDETLNITVITPTAVALLDPNSLGKTVTAEIMPASMRPAIPVSPAVPVSPSSPSPSTNSPGTNTPGTVVTPIGPAVTTQPVNP